MGLSDADRIAAAQLYISALASHRADDVPFAPGCTRVEFGVKSGFSGEHLRRSLNRGPQYRVIESVSAPDFTVSGDEVRARFELTTKTTLAGRTVGAHVDETFLIPAAAETAQIHRIRAHVRPSLTRQVPRVGTPTRPLNARQLERLNSGATRTAIKWMSRAQTWLFTTTGGRFGNRFLRGAEVGILTTTGRKSGEARECPVLFLREGDRIVLVASQGGRATNPAWYGNIQANPEISFRTRDDLLRLSARDATRTERDEYWPKLDAMYPDFENYRSYTDREIPILICDPL